MGDPIYVGALLDVPDMWIGRTDEMVQLVAYQQATSVLSCDG